MVFFILERTALQQEARWPEKGQNTRKSLSLLLSCPAALLRALGEGYLVIPSLFFSGGLGNDRVADELDEVKDFFQAE